ncbi:MAG: efflux RND transporter periplasmic adaptor subunit [Acidobacteriota bacterium]
MSKQHTSLFLAALLGCSIACQSVETETAPPPPRPVRTAIAVAAADSQQTAIAGVTQASAESKLSFRVSGTVERLAVKVGQSVSRGQTIATLDTADLEISAGQAAASLAQVQALDRQARADFDRFRGLYEDNNASKSDLDAARAASESADAQVEAAGRALEQARRQLGYAALKAPASGAIVSVEIEENETIQAGQTVVVLASGVRPEVVLAVSEVNIPFLNVGDPVAVTIEAVGGQRLAGEITEVGVAATPGSTTFPAVVRLEEVPEAVRSGMAAEVFVQIASGGDGVVVPLVAIGEDGDGRYVFTIEDQGESAVVKRRSVEVGTPIADGILVTSGLAAGEKVVTAGVRRLTDGMVVRAGAAG